MTAELRQEALDREPLDQAPAVQVPGDRIAVDYVPADPVSAEPAPAPQKKTWREQRWERRRRRIWFEELLAWILVPVIVFGTYLLIDAVLSALGTSPAAIIEGVKAILAAL
jgi:hypothetical protein